MALSDPEFDKICRRHGTPIKECDTPVICAGVSRGTIPDDLPDSPMSPIEATGIEFHGVYMANIKAGFSQSQSLYLLAVQMTGNPGIAPSYENTDPT